jgi:hypothetical protein
MRQAPGLKNVYFFKNSNSVELKKQKHFNIFFGKLHHRRHDIWHDDTQQNDTQHNGFSLPRLRTYSFFLSLAKTNRVTDVLNVRLHTVCSMSFFNMLFY